MPKKVSDISVREHLHDVYYSIIYGRKALEVIQVSIAGRVERWNILDIWHSLLCSSWKQHIRFTYKMNGLCYRSVNVMRYIAQWELHAFKIHVKYSLQEHTNKRACSKHSRMIAYEDTGTRLRGNLKVFITPHLISWKCRIHLCRIWSVNVSS